jgi:hypothetical protein
MIAARVSCARHGSERGNGNAALTPYRAVCADRSHHLGNPRIDRTHQLAKTRPAIGAPTVSVTNISVISNQPAPCHAHQVPWLRQTR